uniref:Uncharacterized protein n=1 Tax=Zea mays TaxID=4577 RepID=A0A804P510_MAIZE
MCIQRQDLGGEINPSLYHQMNEQLLRVRTEKNEQPNARTLLPSSWAMPSASAVLPVAGGPARSTARPAIFFWRIMSTASPAASRAAAWPTNPAANAIAIPLACSAPIIRKRRGETVRN